MPVKNKKGFILCKWQGKVAKVFCPPLFRPLSEDWIARNGALGRWCLRVREDGACRAVQRADRALLVGHRGASAQRCRGGAGGGSLAVAERDAPRRGKPAAAALAATFIEVKFRRYLKTARAADLVAAMERQLEASCRRWHSLFGARTSTLEQTVNRAWLARILRFYAKKGRRHGLTAAA